MFTYLKNMYLKLIRIVGIYIISLIYVPLNLLHRSIHYTSEAAVQSISPTILGTSPAFPVQPRCVWIRCSISWTYSCTGRPCGSSDDPRRVSRPLPFCHPQLFHLLHDPEEIAACQLRQLVNCPAAAKEFGK